MRAPFLHLLSFLFNIMTSNCEQTLGKPVLVMRDTTERPEAVEAGTVKLVGSNTDKIVFHCRELLDNHELYQQMAQAKNPYGDGKASQRIVETLLKNI